MKKLTVLMFAFFFLITASSAFALDGNVCMVYFTGDGCPNCAITGPHIFDELVPKYAGKLVVIEYEIYKITENQNVVAQYSSVYGTQSAIPLVVFGKNATAIGRYDVLAIDRKIDAYFAAGGNPCPLIDGSSADFSSLDAKSLPGKPVIWPKQSSENNASCSLGDKKCVQNVYSWTYEECNAEGKWNVLNMCEYGCTETGCNPEPAGAKYVWTVLLILLAVIIAAAYLYWRVSK